MNITLSADKGLVEKSRHYAQTHKTSLNNLIREYMRDICGVNEAKQHADEFRRLAMKKAGKSPNGYTFERDAIYDR